MSSLSVRSKKITELARELQKSKLQKKEQDRTTIELWQAVRRIHSDLRYLIFKNLPLYYVALFCRIMRPQGCNRPSFWKNLLLESGFILEVPFEDWIIEQTREKTLTCFYYQLFDQPESVLAYPEDEHDTIDDYIIHCYGMNYVPCRFFQPEWVKKISQVKAEVRKMWSEWQLLEDVRKDICFQQEIFRIRGNDLSLQIRLPVSLSDTVQNYNQVLMAILTMGLSAASIDPLLLIGLDFEPNNLKHHSYLNIRAIKNRFLRLRNFLMTGDILIPRVGRRLFVVKQGQEIQLHQAYPVVDFDGVEYSYIPPELFDFVVEHELFTREVTRDNYMKCKHNCYDFQGYTRYSGDFVTAYKFGNVHSKMKIEKVNGKVIHYQIRVRGLDPIPKTSLLLDDLDLEIPSQIPIDSDEQHYL